jgi:serine/threonine protein kinase
LLSFRTRDRFLWNDNQLAGVERTVWLEKFLGKIFGSLSSCHETHGERKITRPALLFEMRSELDAFRGAICQRQSPRRRETPTRAEKANEAMPNDEKNDAADLMQIIQDVVKRRSAGETLDDETVLASHTEVSAEELRRALANLRQITRVQAGLQAERRLAEAESDGFRGSNDLSEHILPETISRYRPEAFLGEGTFGKVYRAYDPQHDCHVALKISKTAILTREDEQFFFREARAAARLVHPGIVGIRDSGQDGDRFFIVSELIEGQTLDRIIAARTLDIDQSIKLMIKVCEALEHAHLNGVVHRDIKPENIIVDRSGQPLLMDFGLAKRAEGEATLTVDGNQRGTLLYMSPEQVQGKSSKATAEMDIYAVGIILYELLTGTRPFAGDGYILEWKHVHEEPPSPRRRNAKVSKDLETIVLKCLSKDAIDRFHPAPDQPETASPARTLGEELTRCLHGEPIVSRRISRLEYAARWANRHRLLAGLLATAFLLVTAVIAGGAREIYSQRRAKKLLSDNLLTTAELYGRRGEWQKALTHIEQAEDIGSFDPVRVEIARIKALQALNRIEESRASLDELYSMSQLGKYKAEATYLQGMSLLTRAEQTKGFALLREAQKMEGLSQSQKAVIEALTAPDSLSGLKAFERSLELDAFSQETRGFLVFANAMLGNDAEGLRHAEVAMLLFPNDPNFPLLAAYIEGRRGNMKSADRYLDSSACEQLNPELVRHYREIIYGLPVLANATVHMWDFGTSREDFDQFLKESAVVAKITAAIDEIGKYSSADQTMTHAFSFMDVKGPECYEIAFQPFQELASLRTMSYLINGKGDPARIDNLINNLKRSADMHPDSMFDYCRGRLLFERDQSAAATEAFKEASRHHSMFGSFSDLGCFAVARCEYERFRNKEITDLALAVDFANQRVQRGNVSTTHAKMLLHIALAGGDYDLARKLVPLCGAKTIDGEPVELKKAGIELADGNYLEAVRILEKQAMPDKHKARADEILRTARAKLLEVANAAR